MGRRRYRRIKSTLSLAIDTSPERIDAFCEGIRELIRRHPYTRKDYYLVYFHQISPASLDVWLECFLECPDLALEMRERHRLLADILRLVDALQIVMAGVPRMPQTAVKGPSAADVPEEDARMLRIDPPAAGRRRAAQIAGPPLTAEKRPGPVQFTGPTADS
jgi:MscS family membrane protein